MTVYKCILYAESKLHKKVVFHTNQHYGIIHFDGNIKLYLHHMIWAWAQFSKYWHDNSISYEM